MNYHTREMNYCYISIYQENVKVQNMLENLLITSISTIFHAPGIKISERLHKICVNDGCQLN